MLNNILALSSSVFSMLLLLSFSPSNSFVGMMTFLIMTWGVTQCYFSWPMSTDFIMGESLFVDKISSSLILLSMWICYLSMMTSKGKVSETMTLILLFSLCLVFLTSSAISFFIIFEMTLVPTLSIILGWGYQPERLKAVKFIFFYTIVSSIPYFGVVAALTSEGSKIVFLPFPSFLSESWAYVSIFLVFLVKMPIFLGHLWLPKAHVEAPALGSMVLAGILLKIGGYGIIRFLPMVSSTKWSVIFVSISLWGAVLSCLMCLFLTDLKAVIAYASVSHMNFMTSSLLLGKNISVSGTLVLMISHGISSSGLFLMTDFSYSRWGSRSLLVNKYLINLSPLISLYWFMNLMLNLGLPPSLGSMSEFMLSGSVISSLFENCFIPMVLYFFFTGVYSIHLFYLINHGKTMKKKSFIPLKLKESLLIVSHIIPSFLLILKLELMVL